MLMASIDAAIDGRTGGLQAQLNMLPQIARDYSVSRCVPDTSKKGIAVCTLKTEQRLKVTLITVDFDLIRDDRCRREFQSIGTTWNLDDTVVDSLLDMGSALLRSSAQYQDLVRQLNGRAPEGASGAGSWPGQTLAGQACKRLKHWADAQKASAS